MEFKLLLKKINDSLTDEETKIFEAWYNESPKHRNYYNRVKKNYPEGLDKVNVDIGWKAISSKINNRKRWRSYLKFAAAFIVLLVAGRLWLMHNTEQDAPLKEETVVSVKNHIEIGTDKATLTLDDGSRIALEKGNTYQTDKVSSNGERLVYKGDDTSSKEHIAQNTLTIQRGGQFFLVLADGTKVWINSETQLKYPVAFMPGKARKVELVYGEAYFEVSPSSEHNGSHFLLYNENQKVDVLGTQFNIKAYRIEDEIVTTLVEGEVFVGSENDLQKLSPGYQSKLKVGRDEFTLSLVDVYDEISWKDGIFTFKNKSLEGIMEVLSRWYDINVIFKNEDIKTMTFNGVFRKSKRIDDILDIIQNTNEVEFEINQKTITMK